MKYEGIIKTIQKREEERKKTWGKQKITNKVVDFNPTILIITLYF